ncbi:GTPase SAR1 family protein [Paenibacillus xylanexedens]|uniref:GTPase SAR1 family protein n=1 Tax=Paenibacillus xylanexedens TaxID=528191 RepID=A0ABS4RX09_PAEXY|nr:GTPase SAR1 family protein [Paenibacillus xylanexedens]MCP1423477.1 GTPase SAR1 family protein [Paenibacillus xylanexedens]
MKRQQPEERPLFYDIVCPYCFSKFSPEEVVFRAAHHRDDDEDYALGEDAKLNRYRERFGLDTVFDMEAVLAPHDVPEEHRIYSDNIVMGLNDRYGVVTRRRLCPQCHNELPVTAGKAPSNIISIIGASQVGKSVYMTSLIHTLQHYTADHFDAACMPLNAEISRRFRADYEEPLFERGDLLDSTQKEKLQEPFIFQFVFKDEDKAPLTLVFFDVAGEGMVEQDYLGLHGQHIKNSAGILFMVDPLQIRSIRDKIRINLGNEPGEWTPRYDEPRDVVLTMFGDFIAYQDKAKTNIPTAVVLTKSDMLHSLKDEEGDYIKSNSNVFRNMVHRDWFDLTEFENIDGEIRRFIEKVDRPFKGTMDVYFKDTAYFAVSALGSNPVDMKLQGVVSPIRVDEPFLWLLYKLKYIEGRVG